MSGYKFQTGGVERSSDREYGISQALINFWDLTKKPTENDREAKLGKDITQRGVAVFLRDEATFAAIPVDGYHGSDVTSIIHLEPDNWVPRGHVARFRKRDNTWDVRLVADHTNDQCDRKHRNTYVIDQCHKQLQGTINDALWIADLDVKVKQEELIFNSAGFLQMYYEGSEGAAAAAGASAGAIAAAAGAAASTGSALGGLINAGLGAVGQAAAKQAAAAKQKKKEEKGPEGQLGTVAFNINKRGGYVTDGQNVAQFWHVFHLSPPNPKKPPAKQVAKFRGQTVTDSPFSGKTQTDPTNECEERPSTKWQGTLRGDMMWDFQGKLGHWTMDETLDAHDCGDCVSLVHFMLTNGPPVPPARELFKDPKSCQPILERKNQYGIRGWVRTPSMSTISVVASTYASILIYSIVPSIVCSWDASAGGDSPPKAQYPPDDSGQLTSSFTPGGPATPTPGTGTKDGTVSDPQEVDTAPAKYPPVATWSKADYE